MTFFCSVFNSVQPTKAGLLNKKNALQNNCLHGHLAFCSFVQPETPPPAKILFEASGLPGARDMTEAKTWIETGTGTEVEAEIERQCDRVALALRRRLICARQRFR
jgi:hypothetical protein